jgi:hypothetical protein
MIKNNYVIALKKNIEMLQNEMRSKWEAMDREQKLRDEALEIATVARDKALEKETVTREHEQKLRDEALKLSTVARDEALKVATMAMDKRLDSMNEFRHQLEQAEQTFVHRPEWEAKHILLEEALKTHANLNDMRFNTIIEQLAGTYPRVAHEEYSKGVESDLRILRESNANREGYAKANQLYLTFIIAIIGCITGFISLILKIYMK